MIEMNTSGVKEVLAGFKLIQQRVGHGSPYFKRAALRGHRDTMQHFRDERGPNGPWAPWAASTAAARARGRGGNKILVDMGILRGSILFQGTDDDARIFTETEYAATHQYGDKGRKIPARPFLWWSPETVEELKDAYIPWLLGGKLII